MATSQPYQHRTAGVSGHSVDQGGIQDRLIAMFIDDVYSGLLVTAAPVGQPPRQSVHFRMGNRRCSGLPELPSDS